MQRIAFIGLGTMGTGMAGRLLDSGFPVALYNRTAERAAALREAGAEVKPSPAEAAQTADVVICMVADDIASKAVWLGPDGILKTIKAGAVAVDSSTLSPSWIRTLAQAVRGRGCELLDAPVTGSKTHAASGELQFLVGGDSSALEQIRPVLKCMSRRIVHVGPSGSGALLKLINNYLCGVQAASLAEGLTLIERSGLDRERSLEVLTEGAPGSPLIKTVSARMTSGEYAVNFFLHLMQKDLSYATQEAESRGLTFETGLAALRLFKRARERGLGEKDFSAVVEAMR